MLVKIFDIIDVPTIILGVITLILLLAYVVQEIDLQHVIRSNRELRQDIVYLKAREKHLTKFAQTHELYISELAESMIEDEKHLVTICRTVDQIVKNDNDYAK